MIAPCYSGSPDDPPVTPPRTPHTGFPGSRPTRWRFPHNVKITLSFNIGILGLVRIHSGLSLICLPMGFVKTTPVSHYLKYPTNKWSSYGRVVDWLQVWFRFTAKCSKLKLLRGDWRCHRGSPSREGRLESERGISASLSKETTGRATFSLSLFFFWIGPKIFLRASWTPAQWGLCLKLF